MINIETDFSWAPSGRYVKHGPHSGEGFRTELLYPALDDHEQVTVNLDGAIGYGSSFLEEAFGGLVRENNFSSRQLHKKLNVVSVEFPSVIEEIWEYIDEATQVKEEGEAEI